MVLFIHAADLHLDSPLRVSFGTNTKAEYKKKR